MTSRTGSSRRILGDLKKVRRVETRHRMRRADFRLIAEALGRCRTRCVRGGGRRWKSQNRKIVPLSPYVEKPLNSEVIISFVPEQSSRYVFFEFRDSYVLFLWTFDVRFTHSHIWLWYNFIVEERQAQTETPAWPSQKKTNSLILSAFSIFECNERIPAR